MSIIGEDMNAELSHSEDEMDEDVTEDEEEEDWIELLPIGPCEHFQKPISGACTIDELFPIPLEQFYRNYIQDIGFWHEVCTAAQCKDISCKPLQENKCCQLRVLNFSIPVEHIFAPKATKVEQLQRVFLQDRNTLIFETVSLSMNVAYADSFRVVTKWNIWMEEQHGNFICWVKIWIQVDWKKTVWIKGMIERNAIEGAREFFVLWLRMAKDRLRQYSHIDAIRDPSLQETVENTSPTSAQALPPSFSPHPQAPLGPPTPSASQGSPALVGPSVSLPSHVMRAHMNNSGFSSPSNPKTKHSKKHSNPHDLQTLVRSETVPSRSESLPPTAVAPDLTAKLAEPLALPVSNSFAHKKRISKSSRTSPERRPSLVDPSSTLEQNGRDSAGLKKRKLSSAAISTTSSSSSSSSSNASVVPPSRTGRAGSFAQLSENAPRKTSKTFTDLRPLMSKHNLGEAPSNNPGDFPTTSESDASDVIIHGSPVLSSTIPDLSKGLNPRPINNSGKFIPLTPSGSSSSFPISNPTFRLGFILFVIFVTMVGFPFVLLTNNSISNIKNDFQHVQANTHKLSDLEKQLDIVQTIFSEISFNITGVPGRTVALQWQRFWATQTTDPRETLRVKEPRRDLVHQSGEQFASWQEDRLHQFIREKEALQVSFLSSLWTSLSPWLLSLLQISLFFGIISFGFYFSHFLRPSFDPNRQSS